MLFACCMENTLISIGVFRGERLLFHSAVSTDKDRTADEYSIIFRDLLSLHRVPCASIQDAILASVVRPLNETLTQAIGQLFNIKPLLVGPGVKTGLDIKTDMPSQVGADLVANAVGALSLTVPPLVIIDLGTATTLTAINNKGELCGVMICPGVRSSLDALSAKTTELPGIDLYLPRHLLGRNTIDAMLSGVIYGHAAMIDGLLDRITDEWNNKTLMVLATGTFAEKIIPHCRVDHTIRTEPNLTLMGLLRIFQQNDRRKAEGKPGT